MLPLAAAALVGGAAAWVTTAQYQQDSGSVPLSDFQARNGAINRLWSSPIDSTDARGLGMGINYAWDPFVCGEDLEHAFSENGLWGLKFADCEAIMASVRRAFKSWSDNHPKMKFFDVTVDCETRRRELNLPEGTKCDFAEIWVTTTSNSSGADAAATTVVTYRWATDFTHTNGATASAGVWEAARAEIGFSMGICWYLDATFCGNFHKMKANMGVDESLLLIRLIVFGIWGIAMAEMFWRIARFAYKQYLMCELSSTSERRADKATSQEGAMEFYYQMERMSRINYSPLILRLIFLTVPLMAYEEIILPCWECYDFEAAATHEIGHALGLAHPDAGAKIGENYFYNRGLGDGSQPGSFGLRDLLLPGSDGLAVNCTHPAEKVAYRTNATDIDDTIMGVFTFNNPSSCIFQDDLDAINVLYPVCEDMVRVPLCIKDAQYLGIVRTATYVLLPIVIALSLVIASNECAKHIQARRRSKLVSKMADHLSAFEQSQQAKIQYKRNHNKKNKAQLQSQYAGMLAGGEAPIRDSGALEGLSGQTLIKAAGAKWKDTALRNKTLPISGGGAAGGAAGGGALGAGAGLAAAAMATRPPAPADCARTQQELQPVRTRVACDGGGAADCEAGYGVRDGGDMGYSSAAVRDAMEYVPGRAPPSLPPLDNPPMAPMAQMTAHGAGVPLEPVGRPGYGAELACRQAYAGGSYSTKYEQALPPLPPASHRVAPTPPAD